MEHYKNLSLEDIEGEEWRDVVGYEGLYQVSNMGRIKSKKGILNQSNAHHGYLSKTLSFYGKSKTFYVHKIVANAWIGESGWSINGLEINHIDGDKRNNCSSNLELITRAENMKHAYDNDLLRKVAVYQYSSIGVYERKWNTINAAAKFHHRGAGDIVRSCKGERAFCNNHLFRYYKMDKLIVPDRKFKKVLCLDFNGNIVKEYDSAKIACSDIGVKENSIVCACLRNRKCKGFIWKYK